MRRGLAWCLAALCWVAGWAHAQDVLPVPPLAGRVIDQTATLSADQAQALAAKLAAIETQRGSQVVVLLVPSTAPEDIAAFAQRVGDTWKIGRREVGDGLLIVVAKNDRAVRIEVAKALEGAIPDLAAKRIIAEQITPAFRAGDFAGGLNAAVDQLDRRIAGEALPEPQAGSRDSGEPEFDLQELTIFLFVVVPIVGAILTSMLGRRLGSFATAGAVGGIGWWASASALIAGLAAIAALVLVGVMGVGTRRSGGRRGHGGPTVWGGGGGGGWGSGGGGGGGFSSGGGGDFGGGGASGNW